MLPEGYMWHFPKQGDRPRRIEKMISELIGEEKSNEFWKLYHENYVSEIDIKKAAEYGFNSVRLPINSRNILESVEPVRLNEDIMHYIDRVIEWCSQYGVYVIWDLHGAPGGQTGTNIDDSENDEPELFTNEANHKITVELWRILAERYKDQWIIAGYDLLNEPLPNWNAAYNHKVMPLYNDIIRAIREVDKNHMIILEGVHWATDWSIFTELIDDNILLQFHKYWNNPDNESIQVYLDKREELNVPIFMGEGGENNSCWYSGAFRLYEDNNISWNFWTWKKIDSTNSPYSVKKPIGWNLLVNYLEGGDKPDKLIAEKILWEYLNNLCLENCDYYPDVINSLFRRTPLLIPAIFYGYGGKGTDFNVKYSSNNNVGFRVNDNSCIDFVNGSHKIANFEHNQGQAWTEDEWLYLGIKSGDWFAYDFTISPSNVKDIFSVRLCVFSPNDLSTLRISLDGIHCGNLVIEGNDWMTLLLEKSLYLNPGKHRVIIMGEKNTTLFKWLEIK